MRFGPATLGRMRLTSQLLLAPGGADVQTAVRWMTAMQAQDLAAALWAVGARVPSVGVSGVRAALNAGTVVRSWPLRGTLHLVASEDLRWILALTSPRTVRAAAGRHRQLAITERDVAVCRDIALELAAGRGSTRAELFAAFEAAGQATAGQRGIHLLWMLCQSATLVLGPVEGTQQRFVPFDEWIPVSREVVGEEAVAELLTRYVRSHGPATIRDFAWWSGIALTPARAALAAVRPQLEEVELDGTTYWLPIQTAPLLDSAPVPGGRSVLALPGFDEFLLGYADRSLVLPPVHASKIVPGGNGVFRRTVVVGGQVVGTWDAATTTHPAMPTMFDSEGALSATAGAGFRRAAERYARFLNT